jgi:hypothetical protein
MKLFLPTKLIYLFLQFEAVLKERNELEGRLQQEKQVHLRRLAALKEQINIARLSFGSIINMLQSEPNIDNEVSVRVLLT